MKLAYWTMITCALSLVIAIGAAVVLSRNSLARFRKKIDRIGAVEGKSYGEIAEQLGPPHSVRRIANVDTCEWTVPGLSLTLTFENDHCNSKKIIDS